MRKYRCVMLLSDSVNSYTPAPALEGRDCGIGCRREAAGARVVINVNCCICQRGAAACSTSGAVLSRGGNRNQNVFYAGCGKGAAVVPSLTKHLSAN